MATWSMLLHVGLFPSASTPPTLFRDLHVLLLYSVFTGRDFWWPLDSSGAVGGAENYGKLHGFTVPSDGSCTSREVLSLSLSLSCSCCL